MQSFFEQGPLLTIIAPTRPKALLFPNPTTGVLTVENENLTKIVVYDLLGKVVKEFEAQPQIDVSMLSKGVYLIKLFSEREVSISKIIIN
ncbi:T9SS type A sorting domain-containing protein [Flavobacterium sp.]